MSNFIKILRSQAYGSFAMIFIGIISVLNVIVYNIRSRMKLGAGGFQVMINRIFAYCFGYIQPILQ